MSSFVAVTFIRQSRETPLAKRCQIFTNIGTNPMSADIGEYQVAPEF
jgi:hypothetical protein